MTSDEALTPRLLSLLARQELHDLNARYCRAVDRLDEQAFMTLFHPDAVIDSGVLRGEPAYFVKEFAKWVRLHARVITHCITNEWFRIEGNRARGESYVIATSRLREDNGERDVLTVGRYLDCFEDRSSGWKFTERRFVLDHSIARNAHERPWPECDTVRNGQGGFAPHDPIYRFWESDGVS